MNNQRTIYWAVGLEIWQGVQEKLKSGCWRHVSTEKLVKTCETPEEAKKFVRKLNLQKEE